MGPQDVKNLGFRTDLMVLGAEATFEALDDGLIVKSPGNQTFFWGNFLLLAHPPAPDAIDATVARFRAAMSDLPDVRHVAIGWDAPGGDDETFAAFEAQGFDAERGMVLTTAAPVAPRRQVAGLEIRAPRGVDEWEQLLQMQLDSSPMPFPRPFREAYQRTRNGQVRAAIAESRALWLCAWIDGRIVGSMGLFAENGLGRYQSVQTHPDFRRRGVCSALLAATAQAGRSQLGAERLVIVADAGSTAEAIYRQHGFEPAAPTHGVCLPPAR